MTPPSVPLCIGLLWLSVALYASILVLAFFSGPVKNVIENFVGIALSLYSAFDSIPTFTVLILQFTSMEGLFITEGFLQILLQVTYTIPSRVFFFFHLLG